MSRDTRSTDMLSEFTTGKQYQVIVGERPPGRLNFVKVTYERIEVHFSPFTYK